MWPCRRCDVWVPELYLRYSTGNFVCFVWNSLSGHIAMCIIYGQRPFLYIHNIMMQKQQITWFNTFLYLEHTDSLQERNIAVGGEDNVSMHHYALTTLGHKWKHLAMHLWTLTHISLLSYFLILSWRTSVENASFTNSFCTTVLPAMNNVLSIRT